MQTFNWNTIMDTLFSTLVFHNDWFWSSFENNLLLNQSLKQCIRLKLDSILHQLFFSSSVLQMASQEIQFYHLTGDGQ